MTLIVTDDIIQSILDMNEVIQEIENVFRDLGEGKTVNSPRIDHLMYVDYPNSYYSFKTIVGGSERSGLIALRVNSDMITYSNNRRVKLPIAKDSRYVGLVFLFDAKSLELKAIMNDGHLQRTRVAATVAVGAKYLARKDSNTVGLFGTGWQAETIAIALSKVRNISHIKIFSPNPEHRRDFAYKIRRKLDINVTEVNEPNNVTKEVNMIVSATNSHDVVYNGNNIKDGIHLSSIRGTEMGEECWKKSDLIYFSAQPGKAYNYYFTRTWEEKKFKGTHIDVGIDNEFYEKYKDKCYLLSDLLTGKSKGRISDSQITFFRKNQGLGIEFVAVAKIVYEKAKTKGLGIEIKDELFTQTTHP